MKDEYTSTWLAARLTWVQPTTGNPTNKEALMADISSSMGVTSSSNSHIINSSHSSNSSKKVGEVSSRQFLELSSSALVESERLAVFRTRLYHPCHGRYDRDRLTSGFIRYSWSPYDRRLLDQHDHYRSKHSQRLFLAYMKPNVHRSSALASIEPHYGLLLTEPVRIRERYEWSKLVSPGHLPDRVLSYLDHDLSRLIVFYAAYRSRGRTDLFKPTGKVRSAFRAESATYPQGVLPPHCSFSRLPFFWFQLRW